MQLFFKSYIQLIFTQGEIYLSFKLWIADWTRSQWLGLLDYKIKVLSDLNVPKKKSTMCVIVFKFLSVYYAIILHWF